MQIQYYKINNLVDANGYCDYKGLDISQFITNSQYYHPDIISQNYCVLASSEILNEQKEDVITLNELDYETERQNILNFIEKDRKPSEVELLKAQVSAQEEALVEIAELLAEVLG